eukprot:CAMPEP_0194488520 /NCGR_PEP_ID=MMETSP0253-20130528/8415_1 /TAXON_ID=2966 /ORGANISM="Noctiluca scintillans" /LENGTH=49 /DNA_ID=CAMNT_0039328895 /DNA_START=12 /DNA_END=161 /DNA_ORIENTATION=+
MSVVRRTSARLQTRQTQPQTPSLASYSPLTSALAQVEYFLPWAATSAGQ